jgi:putative tricarboxylic transport membrane protein
VSGSGVRWPVGLSALATLTDAQRDRLLAVLTAVFAGSLIAGARNLEDSLLSDAVGAGGVPQGVGIVMALAAVALFAKSFFGGAGRAATVEPQDKTRGERDGKTPSGWGAAKRTVGLVAILAAYGLLLPWLGYPLSIGLLVLASGWLAGAPFKAPLLMCAVAAGPVLWAIFDWALRVRMPVGSLWS